MDKNSMVDITVEVIGSTSKALRIFDGEVYAWIPKSHISYSEVLHDGSAIISMPYWLAHDRELI